MIDSANSFALARISCGPGPTVFPELGNAGSPNHKSIRLCSIAICYANPDGFTGSSSVSHRQSLNSYINSRSTSMFESV